MMMSIKYRQTAIHVLTGRTSAIIVLMTITEVLLCHVTAGSFPAKSLP